MMLGNFVNSAKGQASDIVNNLASGAANQIKGAVNSIAAGESQAKIDSLLGGGTGIGYYSSTGIGQVIKMNYKIEMGFLHHGSERIMLVSTDSYKQGVSLSEIKWGFFSTSSIDSRESSFLEFTIHDIAGQSLENFLKIRQHSTILYFTGPTSGGNLWIGQPAPYAPKVESCEIQFSQTQGFTYKITAIPTGQLSKSPAYSTFKDITINGINHDNVAHSNTFKDYLDEFAYKWNSGLKNNPEKIDTAKIEFIWVQNDAANDDAMKQMPIIIEKEGEIKRTGDAEKKIQPLTIKTRTTVSAAVQQLWNERFVPKETNAENGIDNNSFLEVNFKEHKDGTNFFDVKCHKKTTSTDKVGVAIPICIGSDKVCKGALFRAQLASISLNSIATNLAITQLPTNNDKNQEQSQSGTDVVQVIETKKSTQEDGGQATTQTVSEKTGSPGNQGATNSVFDGWGQLKSLLNKNRVPSLTIDIDMPYTYAFTPETHGGFLPDAIKGSPTGGMSSDVGAKLSFWWYVDIDCQQMAPVEAISTTYRITKVIHTIGLSGNSTQISLSHLTEN